MMFPGKKKQILTFISRRFGKNPIVLKYLTQFQGYCMIATHDMELVEKLGKLYKPYYFESHITQNNVTFDYKIHPGRGGESNALALLQAFGFPGEIIQDANALVSSDTAVRTRPNYHDRIGHTS